MIRAAFLSGLALLGLVGCDASEPTPYSPTYDPSSTEAVASTEFCALLARNTCAVLRPCCQALPFAFDEAKCRVASRAQCEARRQKSMELGLVYDDVQAGRCVRGTAILLPGCRSPNDPEAADVTEACKLVFHGGRRVGELCRPENPIDCAPPALGVRVVCTASTCRVRRLLSGGEPCDTDPSACSVGLVCEGLPPRCTSIVHPLGAPCQMTAPDNDRCDQMRGRYCKSDSGTPPTCTAMPGRGEECSAIPGCAMPLRCDTDRSGTLRCTDAKLLGQVCGDDRECATRLCAGGLVKVCMPSGIGPPIATLSPRSDPGEYITRIAAACSGIIPDGAGGLAPFVLPEEK